MEKTSSIAHNPVRHPCFNASVKGRFGRVHLPVAPTCTIKCNYCNRKYDCVNESRPGVTSAVLKPFQTISYLEEVLEKEPRITVAGIAGPGDPFANPGPTLETLRLVRGRFPELILCLATNGLGLPPHVDALAELGVSHVTVTVNAVDPEVSQHIYAWVRDGKIVYRGQEAASLLLERQLDGIRKLKDLGITVKVNTVVIPEVNNTHVTTLAQRMAGLGADLLNLIPVYPTEGTPFAEIREISRAEIETLRSEAERYIPQMRHCTRCRADAVGLLGSDRSGEFAKCLSACSRMAPEAGADRPYVAVATQEGLLVNLHLGEAAHLEIWGNFPDGARKIGERYAPKPGTGRKRWDELAEILRDCRAVLVSGIGETPKEIFAAKGILPIVMSGFIEMGVSTIFSGGDLSVFAVRNKKTCSGGGQACS